MRIIHGTTNNASVKKKSKAPIVVIVVIIVVLLLGCLTIGVVALAINMLFNSSENIQRNKVENLIKDIENNTNNSSINIVTNNTKNTSTNTNKANVVTNKTNATNNTAANNTVKNNTLNNTTSNSSAVTDAKSSTNKNPLGKESWGIASKYSTESKNYEDVYIKVTNVVRGEDAKKAVQDYTNSKSYLKYEEPEEGLEWVVLDYDLNFGNFTKSSIGATAEIATSVIGLSDSGSIIHNGKMYILLTRYIGSTEYVKTNQSNGKIAFQMPVGFKDYLVKFGTIDKTNAYFKVE